MDKVLTNREQLFESILQEAAIQQKWQVLDPNMQPVARGLTKQDAYNYIQKTGTPGYTMGVAR
jgi:hypothetical protein